MTGKDPELPAALVADEVSAAGDPLGARRVAWATTIVGGLVFVGAAALLVPWDAVPGGPVTPVAPRSVFSAEEIARAEEFSRWARVWSYSSLFVSLLVAGWFGFTDRGRRLVERLPGPWWARVPLAVAALTLLGRLITFPCAVAYRRLRLDYDLTRQSWSDFAVDVAKGEVLTIAVTTMGLWVLVGCARRWSRAWPAVVGGLLAALVVLGSFVYPVVVEPAFNDFSSLPDGQLRTRILALADREGVEVDDVLVADASRRTTTLNAYVSGFGSTRRVVLYDTTVDQLDQEEVLSVVAHELAHAKHDDVLVGTLLGAAGSLFGVGLLALVVLRRRPGAPAPGEAAVVPVVLALVAIGTFLSAPIQNGISRQIETRADVDALRVTGEPGSFIALQRELGVTSLADPDPPAITQFWFGSHPTTLQRIALARELG